MGFHHLPRGKKLHISWGDPCPARMLKVGVITHQNLPSRMLKPSWIGRPTKLIHPIGGQNSPPCLRVEDTKKLAWKIHASFSIPAVRSKVFLGQGNTALPCPQVSHPAVCFSQTTCPIRTCATVAFSLNCGLCPRITVLGGEA